MKFWANLCIITRFIILILFAPFLKIFPFTKPSLFRAMIKCNNFLTLPLAKREKLLLLPHCLQEDKLVKLKNFAEAEGIKIVVVNGGQMAKEVVKKHRGAFVVAVACEEELVAGIYRSMSAPVFCVWNRRVHGPCKDTEIEEEKIKNILLRRT